MTAPRRRACAARHAHCAAPTQHPAALARAGRACQCRRLARAPLSCCPGGNRALRPRRIQRHLRESALPRCKTLATFDFKALAGIPSARIEPLVAGGWVETGANLIAIGNSGAGKTHVLCAIGHALVEAGRRVLYTRTTDMVQRLQAARRDLALEAALAKRDTFDLIILDDITYAQKDQAESSVLFELIARRYETKSLAIAANQPFSAWGRVFPDQAVTVAAIDRLVHHATILEMNGDSYRRRAAASRQSPEAAAPPTASSDNIRDKLEEETAQ
ncbi:IS21-like element helper ATPase IstB [Salipiger sp. 1_MG-2023]|uniref:IS21-like element helper ATPase IstB n=1 Tax=Salipiger sp. 1_MG-2023 TaxID=3062665 RepID=UPI0026E33B3B|nr:IS21-like element helper ATPase IstB [Salipiger sp. 1_MG-2023]MDO6588534.1 IS21-like element helper ATPase IstB [Salipiger sp. 1_MG-2023]